MAINWTAQVKDPETGRYTHEWRPDGTSHKGLVVTESWTRCVRVMSDVWENQTFVKVWDEENQEVETITIYTTNLSARCGRVSEVDAPAHIIAEYKAAEDRKARIRIAREELHTARRLEEEAQEELKKVVNGREVIVVKGRKVPVGTRGIVRWTGATEWGYRVGIAVTGQDKLTYTSISNCEAVVVGLEPDETPVGGWAAYRDAVLAAENATIASRPKKGHRVRIIADGTKGTLFWLNGDRCGVDPRPVKEQRGRCPDPLWLPLTEVERLDGSRSTTVAIPLPVPAPKKAVLPAPFNEVCFVDGSDALNFQGEVVATLTKNGCARLVEQNPEIRILTQGEENA